MADASKKKWVEKNREHIREYQREYYQKNKGNIREYQKRKRLEYRDKINAKRREYYKEHKEEIYNAQTTYRHKNSKRISELCCASRKRRIEKLREQGIINVWGVLKGEKPKYKEN